MKSFSFNMNYYLGFAILLFIFSLVPITANAQEGAQGFIFVRTTFVGNATTCSSPNQASIDFVLSEMGTTTEITNPIGRWSLNIRSSSLVKLSSANFNGQKISNRVCFDPVTEGIQVTVDDSTHYHKFTGPTVFPATTTDLSTMRGYHFRGYVELLPKSVTVPDVEAMSPINGRASIITPSFVIDTNRISSQFNTTALRGVKLYAVRQSNNVLYTQEASASGGLGLRSIDAFRSPQLPNGIYLWTFHQEFNGYSTTMSHDRSRTWNFTNLPLSAAPDAQSFMVDSQAPTTNTRLSTVVSSVPTTSMAAVEYQHTVEDNLSGMEKSTIYLLSSSGSILLIHPIQHRVAGIVYGPVSPRVLTLNLSLAVGATYGFYVVAEDVAGNISTSTTYSYTVPSTFAVPTLTNTRVSSIASNAATIQATISDSGGLELLTRGTCWAYSIVQLDINCAAASGSVPAHQNIPYVLTDRKTGMNTSTTIYTRGFSDNAAGRGFSPIESFVTLGSTTATTTGATAPVIASTSVTNISAVTARLLTVITSTGGSPITSHGACWDTSLAGLSALSISTPSANCILYTTLPSGAILPYTATTSFTNLPPATLIHYRSFAVNAVGLTDVYGTFTTASQYFDFGISATGATTSYNSVTDDYNLIVDLNHIDQSSYPLSTSTSERVISYEVSVDVGDDGTYDHVRTGTISSRWFGYSTAQLVTFNNLPGAMVRINIVINNSNSPYTETASRRLNNTRNFSLRVAQSATSIVDVVSGSGGGTGILSVTDPGMVITALNPLIRTGQQTTITWDTVAAYDMSCTIYGPSSFIRVTFNPSIDGTTGSASSGPINSAQDFLLECTEPISGDVFRASTRVKTVGVFQEV